jgi:flagellar motor switch protein FliN/FliY
MDPSLYGHSHYGSAGTVDHGAARNSGFPFGVGAANDGSQGTDLPQYIVNESLMSDDDTISLPEVVTAAMAAGTIDIDIVAVLGTSKLQIAQLLKLGRGAVVELDRRISEPVDLYVNRVRIAKGEVVVVDDHIAVTITEVLMAKR